MPCVNTLEFEWNDHSRDRDPDHALLSPSQCSWTEYSDEQFLSFLDSRDATTEGTILHDLASNLIKRKMYQIENRTTFNMYVNDCIAFDMRTEQKIKYSQYAFGRADAIKFDLSTNTLYIFDLKTGSTPAKMRQLESYAAFFCLEYDIHPADIQICLRIYQNGEIKEEWATVEEILPIMDTTVAFSSMAKQREENTIYVF